MGTEPVADQHAYLFNVFDVTLEKCIRPYCLANTPVYDLRANLGCLSRLDQEFSDIHPVLVRRIQFLKLSQKQGQPFSEFLANLLAQGDEADLPSITLDEPIHNACDSRRLVYS